MAEVSFFRGQKMTSERAGISDADAQGWRRVSLIAPSALNILTYPKFGRACYQTPRQRVAQIFTTISPARISSGVCRRYARYGGGIHFFRIKIKLNEASWREKNGPHEKSPSTSSRRKDITDVTLLLARIVNLSAPPLSFVRFYETPTGCSSRPTISSLADSPTLLDTIFIFALPSAQSRCTSE